MNKNKKNSLISLIGAIIGVAIIIVICTVFDYDTFNNRKSEYKDVPFELKVPQIYILSDFVEKYNKINIGMSEDEVIAILGEPTTLTEYTVKSMKWTYEHLNEISVRIRDNKVDRVVLDVSSRSNRGIKLSSEIGTEIEDLEVLREQLRRGMTFDEATQILGDKYIETAKDTEEIICDWYDKKENHMGIAFKDGIITEILSVTHSY